ncbi:MAG: BamA/TamA family outer membrane protein [Bacteroidetes bacterium]|nr:BamA/TamA family outer membrane protein [Bacteroidota bacterium]
MRTLLTCLLLFCLLSIISSQEPENQNENIKKGWSFGAVPAIAFDSDLGFKYGGVLNLYHYGDGSRYPKYDHSIFLEWSRTTKGSGINEFTYDSDKLIPGIRVSLEASYLTEQALEFYGFNGYEAYYNPALEDQEHDDYLSRVFYRQQRNLLRLRSYFQGKIADSQLRWFAGYAFYGVQLDTVDIDRLNEGRDEDDLFQGTGGGLYGRYIDYDLLPQHQFDGGNVHLLKAGPVYDSRDNEANPMKGIWTEAQLIAAIPQNADTDPYGRFAITHRQYFTLIPKSLSFAYRISYQGELWGASPFYMLPFVFNSAPSKTRDGLGGAKTLRGILRNRVVGRDFIYGNNEFRWKVFRTVLFNQNIYGALATFADYGMVTKKYEIDKSQIPPPERSEYFSDDTENLHVSLGLGIYFALNENFVVAVNYGKAINENDGNDGLYIGLNFLY